MCKKRRLIVAAPEKRGPVTGNRNHEVGTIENLGARAPHPAPEGGREMGPVRVLESEDQRPAIVVIAQDRARPVPGGWIAAALPAERAVVGRIRERAAAARAPGRGKKTHSAPARAAERVGFGDPLAAEKTARRQDRVGEKPPAAFCSERGHRAKAVSAQSCLRFHPLPSSRGPIIGNWGRASTRSGFMR